MTHFDLSPLYRTTVGFDRLASLLDNAFLADQSTAGYPPYDIEALDENRYSVCLAVAGFKQEELDIQVERNVLTIKGRRSDDTAKRNFLHQGIATRAFERKFNLADHVVITRAKLDKGLLIIELKHEVPEAMKPRHIEIQPGEGNVLEHGSITSRAA